MNHKPQSPSIVRIIQSDYLALLGLIFPVVTWGLYIAISYFGFLPGLRGRDPIQASTGAPIFFYLGLVALLIGVPVLVWRIRSIQAIFSSGAETSGKIINIGFYKDRGRVEYSYTYQGQSYEGGNAIQKTKRTQALQPGDEVILLVDPQNPKRAVIRDLYI